MTDLRWLSNQNKETNNLSLQLIVILFAVGELL